MTILKNIYIEFLGKEVLSIDRLEVVEGDKIAVIGANGSGKTTLLNLISGNLQKYSGTITRNQEFFYLKQNGNEIEIGNETNYEFLSKVGVDPFYEHSEEFSGGEKIKLYLSNVIKNEYMNLILDEPTTNLDLKGSQVLIHYLKKHQGTVIFSTHNRELIEEVATKIWVIENRTVKEYKGGWLDYIEQKELEKATIENNNEQIRLQKQQLESAIKNKNESLKRISDVTISKRNRRINPGRLAQSKSKGSSQKGISRQIKSLKKRLDNISDEKIVSERKIEFPLIKSNSLHSKVPIYTNNLTISIGNNLLLDKISFQIASGEKVAFIGNNGVGKTTLLNHIFNRDEAITISSNVKFSYVKQDFLSNQIVDSLIDFVLTESEYPYDFVVEILERMGFDESDLERKIKTFSAGEQLRALLTASILNDSNILILDEPTNYLDLEVIQGLEELMKQYPGTILFTSHDRFFVDRIATVIYEISEGQLKRIR
ncbi:ribosomal protection-like ABC-F family protein [Streptococcus sciuri]|uniref:ATP-binding cassette domain-containing protein n=1 Tax=Streptococcus sciuri TaxID=2973939 RepID=A0ABT2F6A9_9STRE|nr:ATP-binding cassette domain-containing protein [Streptococcus sciuri]MCS4487556.1 ATP-binding cassette domain-containing protein [Streptococcus sciuri]